MAPRPLKVWNIGDGTRHWYVSARTKKRAIELLNQAFFLAGRATYRYLNTYGSESASEFAGKILAAGEEGVWVRNDQKHSSEWRRLI